jgi:hypothetical protein
VTLEQIQTWKARFLKAKVCADPEIDAEKHSGGPRSNLAARLVWNGRRKKCQKVRTR